ncbi:MAG: hypothetical protein V7605_2587 [Acidimicrobiaceae bacterium]|jgi:hypothetical protein
MDLSPYIDELHRQLEAAAEAGGDDARALARRLAAPLDAAIRLALLDALSAAAQEITCDLAPGSVELRLRGRDPEFAVTAPGPPNPDPASAPGGDEDPWPPPGVAPSGGGGDDATMARINLRMPDHLKGRVDQAAAAEGLSVNAWLVRAAAAALERSGPSRRPERRGPQGAQRFSGWAR